MNNIELAQAIKGKYALTGKADAIADAFYSARNGKEEDLGAARGISEWAREECRALLAKQIAEKKDAPLMEMLYSTMRDTYVFDAPYNFDHFMTAMEWKREPKARFWQPRRSVLEGAHGIASKIQAFLEDNSVFLGMALPPGCGKTTLIKFLLAYIYGRSYETSNMYCSYSDGMVKMVYDSVDAMLTDGNEYMFGEIFPLVPGVAKSAEYATFTSKSKGDFPTLGLVSLGGSITGRTRANNILVTDDLVKNAEVARSVDRLDKLYQDYTSVITSRTIGNKVKQIMLGTIWSIYDPLSRMLSKHEDDKRYVSIRIPVCDETGKSNFNYAGAVDKYTDEKIAQIKEELDAVDFSCLYLQRGIQKEGMAFLSDSLQYYNGVLPEGEPDNKAFYVDVAFGGGDNLSMPIFYIYGDEWYLVDVIYDRRDKGQTEPRVVGRIMDHGLKMGRFEANNGGDAYAADIQGLLDKQGYKCNISWRKAPTNMSKATRIEQHAPTIKNKVRFLAERIVAKDQSDDYKRFMHDVCTYSFTAANRHDDAPDSLAGFCEYYTKRHGTTVVSRRLW